MFAYEDSLGPVGVAFTDRAGGVSTGSFASLNLAVRTDDEPTAVAANLRRVAAAFTGDPDAPLVRMRQVHGDHVAVVAAAHNPLLVELYDGLVGTLSASIDDPGMGDDLGPEHAAVLEAIRAGDVVAAAAASADLLDHVAR